MRKTRIAIVTNIVPEYRRDFYRRIFAMPGLDVTLFCQSGIRGMNIRSVHRELEGNVRELEAFGLKGERLVWQRLPLRSLMSDFDVIFLYGNPRVLSSVLWGGLLRLLGKRIVIWGQLHTAGSSPVLERIRLGWWRMFRNVFVYTDAEANKLRASRKGVGFCIGMNNGLDQEAIEGVKQQWTEQKLAEWKSSQALDRKNIILSCARLVEKNKFELVIQLLVELVKKDPDIVWCVIGDGEKKTDLMGLAEKLGVDNHVRWLGAIYDEAELAPWFLSSEFLIHPGAIGLSLMHAFGYGLPVVTHNNRAEQMPEIAALEDGVNGFLFEQNNLTSLQEKTIAMLSDSESRNRASTKALETVRESYNSKVMADRFLQMIECAQRD